MDEITDEQAVAEAAAGNEQALSDLLAKYRLRLARMVQLRMNQRLQGRVDASDVVQDAYVEVARVLADYVKDPPLPFYLWLRHITGQQLIVAHRKHLGTKMRDARREVSLFRGALPEASSASLAAQLLGRFSSPSQATVRAELKVKLQEVLNNMDPIDREVLVLRHFEQLSNAETAQVLGLEKSATSKRHIRALERLQVALGNQSTFG